MRSPLGVLWSRSAISWGAPLPPFPFPFLRSACSGPLQGSSSFKLETSQVWQTEASNHTIGKARACRAERRGSKPATDLLVVSVASSAACAGRKMGIAIGPVTAPLPSPVACCRPRPPWKTPCRMVQNKLTRARTDECRTKANRLMIVNVANRLNALVWWLHLLSAKKKGTVSEKQLSRKTQVANCFLQSWRSAPSVQESCCLHPSSSSPITFASCSLLNFCLSSLVAHKSWRRIPAPSCWKPHLSGGFPGPQKRGVSPSRSGSRGSAPANCVIRILLSNRAATSNAVFAVGVPSAHISPWYIKTSRL